VFEVQANNLERVRWLVARHLQPGIGNTSRAPTGRHVRSKAVDGGRRESVAHDVRGTPGGGQSPGGARSIGGFTAAGATALSRKSKALKSGRTALACGQLQRRRSSTGMRAAVRETGHGFRGRDKPLEGANPGRGSGVKQTRNSSGGVNRRGRAKRRGRTKAVTWVVAVCVDAAGTCRDEGANPKRGAWCSSAGGRQTVCGLARPVVVRGALKRTASSQEDDLRRSPRRRTVAGNRPCGTDRKGRVRDGSRGNPIPLVHPATDNTPGALNPHESGRWTG